MSNPEMLPQPTAIPSDDHARLGRALEIYAELTEILRAHGPDQLFSNRLVELAAMRLVDSLTHHLAKLSTHTKIPTLDWIRLTGLRQQVSKVLTHTYPDSFQHLLKEILPPLMESVRNTYNSTFPVLGPDEADQSNVHTKYSAFGLQENGDPSTNIITPVFASSAALINRFFPNSLHKMTTLTDHTFDHARVQMELWFRELPEILKPHFLKRLQDTDEVAHVGTFYELYFYHHFATHLGYSITYEPHLPPYRPDFFVDASTPFIAEILTYWDSVDHGFSRDALRSVLCAIDEATSDYLINVHFHKMPDHLSNSPKHGGDKFLQRLHCWISTLKIDCIAEHSTRIQTSRVDCTLHARARNGILSPGAVYSWTLPSLEDDMLRAIQKVFAKKTKCRPPMPLVMVACGRENQPTDDATICRRLYGPHSITATRDDARLIPFPAGYGFHHESHRRISAILFCTRRWDRSRLVFDMKVFHNPWADYPLPFELLGDMPQLVPTSREPDVAMEWV